MPRETEISAQQRIVLFGHGLRGHFGPCRECGETQLGWGVAAVSVVFKRARLCINKALRA